MSGRPRKHVEVTQVIDLASKGMTQVEIAAFCDVSVDTIHRHFAEAVKKGNSLRDGSLRRKQVEIALSGNPTMLIWLGKQLLSQADKHEVAGIIQHEHTDLSHLPDDKLAEIERLIESAHVGGSKE